MGTFSPRQWSAAAAAVVGACALVFTSPAVAQEINFARDIQPILADKCYHCHGPDAHARKADLRFDVLDEKIGPFAPRDGYAIVTPKNLDDSVLVMRITSDDADVRMPPVGSNRVLSEKQRDLLKQWVEQGAKWGKHWSFEAPIRPQVPRALKGGAWPRNPIDSFILERLEKEGLQPAPEASKESLIRRVTLDLSGLPPTPAEVDAFLSDPSSDAYEKVVDRLLASPRYGERMVWEWLDLARYSDTNGYQNDPTRTMWPWRDWVVSAMNANMPYDQFATWQLAGDLLPDATQEQKIASGFNRNHTYNGEGGRIAEETRVENVMDRVDTTSTAFLGLTVGCAKCHDHKFDPIQQKEYYQLYAYFNQCSESGELKYVNMGNVAPVVSLESEAETKQLASLKKSAKAAEKQFAAEIPRIDAAQAKWEEAARYEKGWIVATPVSAKSTGGATMKTLADSSVLVSGASPDNDVHEIVLRTDLAKVTALRIETLPDDSLPHGGPGRSLDSGNFVLTHVQASAVALNDDKRTEELGFSTAEATFTQEGLNVVGVLDSDPKSGWATLKAPDKTKVSAVLRLAQPVGYSGGTELRLKFHYAWPNNKQHTLGRFRLSLNDGAALIPDIAAALAIDPSARDDAQKKLLREHYRNRVSKEFKGVNDTLAAAKRAVKDYENTLTRVMVMDDAAPRETHILTKGAYDKHEAKVDPGVPSVLHPFPAGDAKNNRLALAKWLFDPANPLTARVTVNRYWQQFFGTGIVKTVDDFGVQGERPVHPELLDWLAVQFRDGDLSRGRGWDVKALHRLMVTSAAYRQSSKMNPAMHERDPENRLLARGPRFRLPSVTIRDQALAASGLLVEKIGGPPVKPYQPPGIWEEATFGFIKYEQDKGDALYRRGLYVFWRRIVGPTEFFDQGSRTVCTVKQSRTNTPLHALATMNDITFVEAARNLAQRVMTTADSESPAKRIELAYRLVMSRRPEEKERIVLLAGFERLKTQYNADFPAALKLLSVGESKRDEKLNVIDHAAYTGVCLTILNLDEALTKE
ncbi:MAG: hypothetical protein QOE14_3036 [Humisphaera sp.]|nr:hypothetical protein [Humisphaera sp.]